MQEGVFFQGMDIDLSFSAMLDVAEAGISTVKKLC